MNIKKLSTAILLAAPLVVSAAPSIPASTDMKAAILKTLSGPVNGPSAVGIIEAGTPQLKMISQMTGSNEPAQITMTKIQDWTRPGCGRLKMVFHQNKMKLKAGGTGNDFYMTQYLDICADGSVPEVPVIPQASGTSGTPVVSMSVKPKN
ncbi:hypothetical protein [Ferrovum myxofaciens]|uniref:Uncharacterized protein n=1 Tax=Ferrovum myxofaciens TaxID=416213 RepID=A0A9E6MXY0_9PROT|nr:hypothetical protein [Ferrovum myxofaciens]QKE37406.1 MAG: hypothetical protein HO273_00565 [Ferrovum myxofaciens]QWY75054.1 MAG: hypothetical protein JVY19_00990 [Ferrovum myxofaciens]QWY77794.1 MAG: hypothetical protein JZL65_01520 [Ferrovum myxofaciens]